MIKELVGRHKAAIGLGAGALAEQLILGQGQDQISKVIAVVAVAAGGTGIDYIAHRGDRVAKSANEDEIAMLLEQIKDLESKEVVLYSADRISYEDKQE